MGRKHFFGLSQYVVLAIVLVSLLVLLIPVSVVKADSVVTFPDPNLEAAIRQAIGKPTGDIYQSDLVGLTSLNAHSQSIAVLSGLEYCTSLRYLVLDNNQISDLTPLSGLTGLLQLYLQNNQISDVIPLAGLASLTYLNLHNNQISNISPLSGLTSMWYLDLSKNQIRDLTPLFDLSGLWYLDLSYNQISDISPLSGLSGLYPSGLYYLDLSNNQISDLSPLSGLTAVGYLDLSNNQISDIQPLVNNAFIATTGHFVDLRGNPLNSTSVNVYIPQLQARGGTVYYTSRAPDQPSNISPSSGATGISLAPTLTSSAFSDPDAGDTHASSRWQITTTSGDYSSLVFYSITDTSNLTTITVPSGTLNPNTTYYWHVSYEGNHGNWSDYSAETSFTTQAAPTNNPPNQPSNISPADADTGVSLTPTLQSSAFSDPDSGDTHAASQWQIRSSSGSYSTPVSGVTSNTALTSFTVPSGNLGYDTTYYWHVRHQDNHGNWSDYSAETSFTTAAAEVEPPSTEWSFSPGFGMTSLVQQADDGGYICLIEGFAGTTYQQCQGYLVKLDSFGSEAWSTALPAGLCWSSFAQTSDGGFVLAGSTSMGSDSDASLTKVTSTGDVSWTTTLGGQQPDAASDVHQTSDGGYIIVGNEAQFTAAFLVKTDSNGNVLWRRTLTTGSGERPATGASVQQTADGGYIVTGAYSLTWFQDPNPANNCGEAGWYNNAYLMKVNSAGNYMWHKTYGGGGATRVHQTAGGGYAFAGTLIGPLVETAPCQWNNTGASFARLVKTDSNGNTVWDKTFGGQGPYDGCNDFTQTADGGYIFVGSLGTGTAFSASLIRTDSAGTELWSKSYGENYFLGSVSQTDDGGYVVGGGLASGGAYVTKLARDVPYSVPTATGTGTALLSPSSGIIQNLTAVNPAQLPPPPVNNLVFPDGIFSFNITGVSPSGTVTVTIQLPSGIPANAGYWKYDSANNKWSQIGYTVVGAHEIAITLADDGTNGDLVAGDGVINDPGGLGGPAPSGGAHSAPVFPSIYVGIGAALGAGIVAYFVRRRLIQKA